jgi:hypothetical protein
VARDAERRELRALLAARQAIVLAGHTHRLEYHDCRLPEGRITQFVANSVWTDPEGAALEVLDEGRASYGNRLPAGQGGAKDARKNNLSELVDEYRPLIGDYFYGRAAGHYRLSVSAARVAVEFFAGDAAQPTRTFVLRG